MANAGETVRKLKGPSATFEGGAATLSGAGRDLMEVRIAPADDRRRCAHCQTTESPLWREEWGTGKPLCNVCGLSARLRQLFSDNFVVWNKGWVTCDSAGVCPKGLDTPEHSHPSASGGAHVDNINKLVDSTCPDENFACKTDGRRDLCDVNQDPTAIGGKKNTPKQRQQPCSIKMFEAASNLDISGGSFVSVARDYIHHEHKKTVIVMPSSAPLVSKSKSRSTARCARIKSNIGIPSTERPFTRSKHHIDSATPNRLEKRIKDLEVSLNRLETLAALKTLPNVEESRSQPEAKVYYSTDPAHPSHWDDHEATKLEGRSPPFPILTYAFPDDEPVSFEQSFLNSRHHEETLTSPSFFDRHDQTLVDSQASRDVWNAWHAYWTAVHASWTSWAMSWMPCYCTPPALGTWRPTW